jgi:hypothetical protein
MLVLFNPPQKVEVELLGVTIGFAVVNAIKAAMANVTTLTETS